jgi:hypothetical protein
MPLSTWPVSARIWFLQVPRESNCSGEYQEPGDRSLGSARFSAFTPSFKERTWILLVGWGAQTRERLDLKKRLPADEKPLEPYFLSHLFETAFLGDQTLFLASFRQSISSSPFTFLPGRSSAPAYVVGEQQAIILPHLLSPRSLNTSPQNAYGQASAGPICSDTKFASGSDQNTPLAAAKRWAIIAQNAMPTMQ